MSTDAYWQPFTPTGYRAEVRQHTIVEGDGVYVVDTEGHRLLDGTAGLWCVNVGHGRAAIADAMHAQARTLAYYTPFEYRNEPAVALAERVAALLPGDLNHVFFTCTGSEAVETAIKIVRGYRARRGEVGRTKIISRDLAYHGVGMGGTSLSGLTFMRSAFEPLLPHTLRIPHHHHRHCTMCDDLDACNLNCARHLEYRIQQEGPETVTAFIMEPVVGAAGVIPPPEGYVLAVADICKKYGVLLIFDEVITGFGRLGTWFAGQKFGVTPDLVTMAKGLTSAYAPLGAVAATAEVFQTFVDADAKPAPEFAHGYTYSGHPVCCAAGLANLDILEAEDLPGNVAKLEAPFAEELQGLTDLAPVAEVRAMGLLGAVEYTAEAGAGFPRRVSEEAYVRGLIVRPTRNNSVLSPPLIVQREHVTEIGRLMREAITAAAG